MPASRFYVPLHDSASMDLRWKLATCTIDFQIKQVAAPTPAQVAEAIGNELPWCDKASVPVILALLTMSEPATYGLAGDSDSEAVECDGRDIARRWLPGAAASGVVLPTKLTFIHFNEAGMRNLLNDINFGACTSPRPTLVSVLTPPTSTEGEW